MRLGLLALAGMALLFCSMPASSIRAAPAASTSQDQIVLLLRNAAGRYGLPPHLLLAIAEQESGLRQDVISPTGDIGIMQIRPSTAWRINRQAHTHYNPYITRENITLGAMYLTYLWSIFQGNLTKVVSAYNVGEGTVMYRGVINWRYVRSVLARM